MELHRREHQSADEVHALDVANALWLLQAEHVEHLAQLGQRIFLLELLTILKRPSEIDQDLVVIAMFRSRLRAYELEEVPSVQLLHSEDFRVMDPEADPGGAREPSDGLEAKEVFDRLAEVMSFELLVQAEQLINHVF